MPAYDVLIIGSGIAGAGAAYELADGARVLLLEREDAHGRHTTGRSAALYIEVKVCETASYASDKLSDAANASDDALAALDLLAPTLALFVAFHLLFLAHTTATVLGAFRLSRQRSRSGPWERWRRGGHRP